MFWEFEGGLGISPKLPGTPATWSYSVTTFLVRSASSPTADAEGRPVTDCDRPRVPVLSKLYSVAVDLAARAVYEGRIRRVYIVSRSASLSHEGTIARLRRFILQRIGTLSVDWRLQRRCVVRRNRNVSI